MRIRKLFTVGLFVTSLLLLMVMPAQAGQGHDGGDDGGHPRCDRDEVAEVEQTTAVEGTAPEESAAEESAGAPTADDSSGPESEEATAAEADGDDSGTESQEHPTAAPDDHGPRPQWGEGQGSWKDHDKGECGDEGHHHGVGRGDHDGDQWDHEGSDHHRPRYCKDYDRDDDRDDDHAHEGHHHGRHHTCECEKPVHEGQVPEGEAPEEHETESEAPEEHETESEAPTTNDTTPQQPEQTVDQHEETAVLANQGEQLASTGLDSMNVLLVGLGLLTAGAGALFLSRRRERTS